MNFKLHVDSQVWNKDTNSLFDYESKDYSSSKLIVNSSGFLVRNDKMVTFQENEKQQAATKLFLTNIKKEKDNYVLSFDSDTNNKNMIRLSEEKVFVVLRHTYFHEDTGIKLKEGDIIKFGKIVFRISTLFVRDNTNYERFKSCITKHTGAEGYVKENFSSNLPAQINEMDKNKILLNVNTVKTVIQPRESFNDLKEPKEKKKIGKKKNGTLCRICLFEDNDPSNPLINPCKCSGTMKYIHLICLREWLRSKLVKKVTNNLTVLSFKNFECEICKVSIPDKIRIKNEQFSIVELEKPENSNHIVLESIPKDKSETKHIYLISFRDKTKITIGRSNESDVKMSDISVSRYHACIKLIDGFYYLEDNSSKFGTLYQLFSEINLLPRKMLALQIGKSMTKFVMEKTWSGFLNCCYKYPHSNVKDYNYFLFLKWNLINENIHNCDNPSDSEATENLSIKEEKEEKTVDRGILELSDLRASKLNNDLQALTGRNHDKKSEFEKDEKYDKATYNLKSEGEHEVFIRGDLMSSSNNFIRLEREASNIINHETRREIIIENPNEDNSIIEEKDATGRNNQQNFLYERIKELQSINNFLSMKEPNRLIADEEKAKVSKLPFKQSLTIDETKDKKLFIDIKKNSVGTKSYDGLHRKLFEVDSNFHPNNDL